MSKKARGRRRSRENTLLLLLLFALGFASSTNLLGAEPESSNVPKLVTRAELESAVEKGEKIVGREIKGDDIAAVLRELIRPESKCVSNAGLQIEKSNIRGDINIDLKVPSASSTTKQATPTGQEDETEDSKTDEEKRQNPQWLTVPLIIKDTTANQPLSINSIGFACMVDLSGSTFESGIDIRSTTFEADILAVGAVFKSGIEVLGTEFKSTAGFLRAKFVGNVEFIGTGGRKSIFDGDADFRESVFSRHASFLGSLFMKRMDFRNAQFATDVSFNNAKLGTRGLVGLLSGPFYGTDFGGLANFRSTHFTNLRILRSVFHGGADFHDASGSRLQLHGVTVSGPLTFEDTKRIKQLELNSFGGSMVVRGEAIFRRAEFDTLTFVRTAFKDNVDFQGLAVRSDIDFQTVSFDGDVHLEDAKLPDPMQKSANESDAKKQPQTKLSDVTLNKGLYIDASQFLVKAPWWAPWTEDKPRFDAGEVTFTSGDDPGVARGSVDGRRVWREFSRAFDQAKNIQLKNYAEYKLRLAEEAGEDPAERTASVASRLFWGYGLRPFRVLLWLVIIILAFAGIYWTQLADVAPEAAAVWAGIARIKYALLFSVRTAWELTYGYDNSTNVRFRAIAMAESLLAKLLLACFAYALTQSSPLLSELMKKLLP